MDAPVTQTVATLRILTLAILSSVGILTCLPFLIELDMPLSGLPAELPYILLVMSLLSLWAASGISKWAVFRTAGKGEKEALKTIYSAHVVRLALREMPAVLGLVASMATGEASWGLALGGLSAAAILGSFPREDEVRQLLSPRGIL